MADKQRVLMYFSYIGTGFRGSQIQYSKTSGNLHPTVQHSIEEALKALYKLEGERPINIHICSRTDTGVHALKAALSVDLPKLYKKFLQPLDIKYKLNKYFRDCSIRIIDVIPVSDSFSIHKACLSKTYFYRVGVLKEEFRADAKEFFNFPISEANRTFFLYPKLFDVEKVEEAASLFVGEKDFATVGRKSNQDRATICNIHSFRVESAQPLMPFDYGNEKFIYYHLICTGTRFLYLMMRSMVGAVLSVGRGKTSLDEIRKFFEKPDPSSWLTKIAVVPGLGLYLADTTLDPQKFITEEKNETNQSLLSETATEKSNSAEAA